MTKLDITKRRLLQGIGASTIALAGVSTASARRQSGGGGVGYITRVGWDKLDGGTTAFEFTGRTDLPNWRVPNNCQHTDDQRQANNVQVRNVEDETPLGLLLPWNRDIPDPGSGPYEFHNPQFGCGTSKDDGRDRELIRVNFRPATEG